MTGLTVTNENTHLTTGRNSQYVIRSDLHVAARILRSFLHSSSQLCRPVFWPYELLHALTSEYDCLMRHQLHRVDHE